VSGQGDVQFDYILSTFTVCEAIMENYVPKRFIGEAVRVYFQEQPLLEKIPGAPDGFIWKDVDFPILTILSEWHDYRRRGRMERNMRPTHATTAERRGSWGVGQDYYRVETSNGRIFDLYYDRAPKSVDDRKGAWYLDKELSIQE
jgi:hypothetical protein